ncbi:hypothetical protein M501DRAFT_997850 [Patellaria atrata CBS 101060]|uniref:Zn(2)-C6 fungal-type domain-containing protein n=1 Tax=Patellaria atrata CBS 101060 TaxID=1346257 RepID=A0A9P4VPP0_9PEZI|nr:hypothetical protein M501DRAFT_997850 [Patellaria atrata CBS 101060]
MNSRSLTSSQHTFWIDDQMSQYPPPPPPDQPHYNPNIYQAPPPPPLLDTGQQEQLQNYTPHLPSQQPIYPKQDPALVDPTQNNHANHGEPRVAPPMVQDGAPPVQPHKGNRLRKACDSCSIRKVKCDESGPPCRACASLDIPCTFDRPSRRRGPPNRHAEAIKKRKLDGDGVSAGQSSPASPSDAARALTSLSTSLYAHQQEPPLTAESICSRELMEYLINDFFTYIHPLCPFPHEQTFRSNFNMRLDYDNKPFLALLASMIAVLVVSFPRKPRQHLKALQQDHHFPNHMALVNRCKTICSLARGASYLDRPDLTVYDAATSYFLGLSGAYSFQYRSCRLYFGEALTILRSLGLHIDRNRTFTQIGQYGSQASNPEGFGEPSQDVITREISRRLFWTIFVGMKTMQQLGATIGEIVIPPHTPTEPYPPLPIEVDDEYIHPGHVDEQPEGVISQLVGFNANVRVYLSYSPLSTVEVAYGVSQIFAWEQQRKILYNALENSKHALDGIPRELEMLNADPTNQHGHSGPSYYPNMTEHMGPNTGLIDTFELENNPLEKRRVQYEVQKANIHVSQLCTRWYLVQKFFNLSEANRAAEARGEQRPPSPLPVAAGVEKLVGQQFNEISDMTEQDMAKELDGIVKDLLQVLGSINQVHIEPNGDSLVSLMPVDVYRGLDSRYFQHQPSKIRSVASALLEVPKSRKNIFTIQAESALMKFLDILVKLERTTPVNGNEHGGQPEDEEADFRHWADLREYQMKFAQQGGIYGFS